MEFLTLTRRNLLRHPLRTLLTCGAVALAIFLVCTLRSLLTTLENSAVAARNERLWVQSAVSLFVSLPQSYQTKIEGVEGVEQVCKWQWFGGIYKEPKNFFGQFAVDPTEAFDLYPELEVTDGSKQDFFDDRQGAMVGQGLVDRFDWKVGDKIPLLGTIFPHPDGPDVPWEFEIKGIYDSSTTSVDNQMFMFHWDYFAETVEAGTGDAPDVGTFVMRTSSGSNQSKVMRGVDTLFENGPQKVQTTTESEFQAQFVSMYGNVGFFVAVIGGAVLFAILLAALNTMLMASREQTRDVGVLKALGFSDARLFAYMLGQSFALCLVGGALGILLAKLLEKGIANAFASMLPNYTVMPETLGLAVGITLLIGLLAGLIPAFRARSIMPVTALSDR
ncbi:MAG: putative ABC transport system permease protein [Planctomycetota bacterium]|jgi:putative ABC transport system permease protein